MRTASRSRFAVVGTAMAALLIVVGLPFAQPVAAATFNVIAQESPSRLFVPQSLSISAGDTITWAGSSGTHDVTSANIPAGAVAFTSPFLTSAATTFSRTFTVAGNYRYFCSLHSDAATANATTQSTTAQVGQFTVVAATTPTPTPTPTPGVSPIASPTTLPPSAEPLPSTVPPSADPLPSTVPPSAAPAPSGNSGGTAPVSSAKPRPPATDVLVDLPGDVPGFAVLALVLALIGSVVIALGIESVRGVARRRPGR